MACHPSADPQGPTGDEVYSEDEAVDALEQPPQPMSSSSQPGLLRPGVVHRLDKGTTGADPSHPECDVGACEQLIAQPLHWS